MELLLDEKGTPNVGPFPCGGVVTVDSKNQKDTRSGQHCAFSCYSRLVRRGARVIASHGEVTGIDHVAFEDPDCKPCFSWLPVKVKNNRSNVRLERKYWS